MTAASGTAGEFGTATESAADLALPGAFRPGPQVPRSCPQSEDRSSRRRCRSRPHSRSLEDPPRRRGLQHEGERRHPGVEEREEAEKGGAVRDHLLGAELEDVVEQRGGDGAHEHEQTQVPEIRGALQHPEPGGAGRARPGHGSDGLAGAPHTHGEHGAHEVQRREKREQGRQRQRGGRALDRQAADETAQGSPSGDPAVPNTSGGTGEPAAWVDRSYTISTGAEGDLRFRFILDTRNVFQNGFRGWFVDDFQVICDSLHAPYDLAATDTLCTGVSLTWRDSSSAAGIAYEVGRRPVGGGAIDTLAAGSDTFFVDTGAVPGVGKDWALANLT